MYRILLVGVFIHDVVGYRPVFIKILRSAMLNILNLSLWRALNTVADNSPANKAEHGRGYLAIAPAYRIAHGTAGNGANDRTGT